MDRKFAIKDPLAESRLFLSRIVTAFILIIVLMIGLVVRLVYLQVVGHEHYAMLSKDNRIKIAPLPPTRGVIYDRKGRMLAENVPTYSLELIPEQIGNLDDTLKRLQQLLNIPDEKIEAFQKLRKRNKSFTSTALLQNLTDEDVAKFAVVRPYFPGVDVYARLVRHYPYGDLTSHVVGYVGRINEQELKTLPSVMYRGTDHIGKTGIEKTYEEHLLGTAGYEEIETNAQARAVNTVATVEPVAGSNIYLTLDIDIQKIAYDALVEFNGAAVAIEVKTGAVLAFVSRPGFDPNPFVSGISGKDYKALQESPDQPLYNRALRGLYPPGSTVKPFLGLAGLEYGVIDFGHRLFCPGYYKLPNVDHKYRDWKKWGHGMVDMNEAITQSCDVYFYDLALALGIDKMHEFMDKFGFGRKTGIDLVGEIDGLMPSKAWKRHYRNQAWFPGETLITGIGQGYTQVTPLQLAHATATLANGGKVITPHLVHSIISADYADRIEGKADRIIPLKPQNVENVIRAMTNVVHGARGTAGRLAKAINYQIAGKTGTAQVFTVKQEEKYNEDAIDFKMRDHALFIAFAPVHDPQIAVAVIAEHGGHGGSVAAPIAGEIIDAYLNQKKDSSP
ncbi:MULTISPECIES: penicillin-binding protein 2 [unclassified Methylomonas]|uniref:penicillin-binding protein 2 n=1 Tax=unclassified Methylomonas TaxID=2608980 RepID=UPI0008D914A5|nr:MULTISPECIES: penicillin-binding protein 2 [unclassified Methylomonas]NJA08386.1 penicillin-binding protein 2 [Methylococcaceae bacterium WWC4]OHX38282.1 penicillin-binding protein 2 [Methylomonas sp. LWB]WGS86611.1 penicillin-binding protein 2 [Methylomonas sp. UP202]